MTQEEWARSDHDLLIELRTVLEILRRDVQGLGQTIANVDERMRQLERITARYSLDRYEQMLSEWHEFKARLRVYGALGAMAMTLSASVLSHLLDRLIR